MFEKDTPLLPELQPYLQELEHFPALRHPLVYSVPYFPGLADFCNQQLRAKQAAIAEALAQHQWGRYIGLHERPYRLEAFLEIVPHLSDTDYWEQLRGIWLDTENIREQPSLWQAALCASRSGREHLMTAESREYLVQLPDPLTVYRGAGRVDPYPFSWTLSRDKARWFANRFNTGGRIYQATLAKPEVLACFLERGEAEIVVVGLPATRISLSPRE